MHSAKPRTVTLSVTKYVHDAHAAVEWEQLGVGLHLSNTNENNKDDIYKIH